MTASPSSQADQIAPEAALDGIYVIRARRITPRSSPPPGSCTPISSSKRPRRAFRTFKGPLEIRPIHHRLEDRVRAHLLICMLAEYLQLHLRAPGQSCLQRRVPSLQQPDPVAKATRSPRRPPRPNRAAPPAAKPPQFESLSRARDPHPQHDPRQRQRGDLPATEHPDRAASTRARADQRARPPAHVAKRQTAPNARKARSPGTGMREGTDGPPPNELAITMAPVMRWRPVRAQRSVDGVRAGRLLSLEMIKPGRRRGRQTSEGNTGGGAFASRHGASRVKNPCMETPDNRHEEGNERALHRRGSDRGGPESCVGVP